MPPSGAREKNMKRSDANEGQPASELISKRIAELGDWRGKALGRLRKLIKEADPDVVEEWKWMNPIWSHDGIICTRRVLQESREADVRQGRFCEGSGASLQLESRRKRAPRDRHRRAIDIHEGEAAALNSSAKPKHSKKTKS
jgi:hypothetical protein